MQNEYTIGSLFSGVGGIEIGFEKQGFKTEWFIENEPYAKEVLKKRFPGTKIYGDITKIDFRTVPKIDILTGGFPCQDISHAGKGVGITGSRSSLWKYYLKAISTLRPRFALIENVSALTIRGLNVVLADLAKIRYDAEWYNISASAVGAFHQRERIFIIAYPNSNRESDVSFNEGERLGFMGEVSDSSGLGCNDGSNNWKERHIQDAEEWGVEEDKSEGNRWKHWSSEICQNVSNPNSSRCRQTSDRVSFKDGSQELEEGSNVEYSESEFRYAQRHSIREEESDTRFRVSNKDKGRDSSRGWWAVEPKLGRVADGIPNRVDRIKCLGNAVVPQCAEVFAKAIKMILQEASHG